MRGSAVCCFESRVVFRRCIFRLGSSLAPRALCKAQWQSTDTIDARRCGAITSIGGREVFMAGRARFDFIHFMHYVHLPENQKDFPSLWVDFPNKYFDPEKGYSLYQRYLSELVLEIG